LGPLGDLLGMIPGMGKMAKDIDPRWRKRRLKQTEAIISSMTIAGTALARFAQCQPSPSHRRRQRC
jgi:signal recognition particle GTPase